MDVHNTKQINKSLESLYLKGEFLQARDLLLQNKSSFNEGTFHYNLGTINLKLNDYAVARYHLEKAIQKGYVNSKVLHNLKSTKTVLKVSDLGTSNSLMDRGVDYALSTPLQIYVMLSLMLLIGLLIAIKGKIIRRVLPVIIGVIVVLSPLLFHFKYVRNINYAISLKDAPMYEGPSKIYSKLPSIKAGSKFIVGDNNNNWFYVKHPDFLNGWIHKDDVALY